MDRKLLDANVKSYNLLIDNLKDSKKLEEIEKDFLNVFTYDQVSMEGRNKMPYESVKRLIELNDKSTFSEREIKEVLNHVKAYEEILNLTKTNDRLTEDNIKDIHQILEKDIQMGGVYRNLNIQIPGAIHQPPSYVKVYDRMKRMFNDLKDSPKTLFEEGIFIHANLSKIHPFLDANGRLSRLILNFYLIKSNYIPISIPLSKREEYFKNIEEFKVNKNIEPLKLFIIKLLNERYEKVINMLEN